MGKSSEVTQKGNMEERPKLRDFMWAAIARKALVAQKLKDKALAEGMAMDKVSKGVVRPLSPENGDWDGFPWDDVQ